MKGGGGNKTSFTQLAEEDEKSVNTLISSGALCNCGGFLYEGDDNETEDSATLTTWGDDDETRTTMEDDDDTRTYKDNETRTTLDTATTATSATSATTGAYSRASTRASRSSRTTATDGSYSESEYTYDDEEGKNSIDESERLGFG